MIKRYGSGNWFIAKATVTSSACPLAGFGCQVAEVYCTYRADEELYTGVNEKPFIFHGPGADYVSHFVTGTEFTVRVNSSDSSVSIVRDGDQTAFSTLNG
jgi:hypothetical protein